VAVDGAEGVEDRGVVGEGSGGTVSYGLDVEFQWCVGGGLCGDDFVEDLVDGGGGGDELGGVGGAEVNEGGG